MLRSALLILTLGVALGAQTSGKKAQVDAIFSAFTMETPGCAVGVSHRGEVVLKAGYGMADLERKVPITPDTVFESGSIAKQFTAATLFLLEQQGKLFLDDPLHKYLPELPDYGTPVTMRHVIHHTGGLREWRAVAFYGGYPQEGYIYNTEDVLRFATKQRSLNYAPGSVYTYANTGYNLAPLLVERALGDGTTFTAFTRKYIFEPLGMNQTQWRDNFRKIVPNRALAYARKDNVLHQHTPIENVVGAGGLLTTVSDLLAWSDNLTHARVGGPVLVKAQLTAAKLTNGRTVPYGAGLVLNNSAGIREISHGGATGGYRTWLGHFPDHALSVAVLCNDAQTNPVALGQATAQLWHKTKTPEAPSKPSQTTYSAAPEELQRVAGRYRNLHDNTIEYITLAEGKLLVDQQVELVPVAPGQFAFGPTDVRYHVQQTNPLRLRVDTMFGDFLLERVEPYTPTDADLATFAGEYESRETASVITIALGEHPGELSYRIGTGPPMTLKPVYPNTFLGPANESIQFNREADGTVRSFRIGDPRIWDLRFTRLR